MKYDMSGGAGVIAAMSAIGKLKPKLNVVGIVPATENMPGGKATQTRRYRQGDERQNDRSDQHRRRRAPDPGRRARATPQSSARRRSSTRNAHRRVRHRTRPRRQPQRCRTTMRSSQRIPRPSPNRRGERYWQLPLYDDYTAQMKSDIADLKNTGGRAAGTLTAAAFLHEFVTPRRRGSTSTSPAPPISTTSRPGKPRARPALPCARSSRWRSRLPHQHPETAPATALALRPSKAHRSRDP